MPRVSTCDVCGAGLLAGARGPLPRRCTSCTLDLSRQLRYRIATARNLSLAADRADVAAALDRAGELLAGWRWQRHGE